MKLTEAKCKSLKPQAKAKKYSDGLGLYLEVMPNGSKYWRMKCPKCSSKVILSVQRVSFKDVTALVIIGLIYAGLFISPARQRGV